MTPSGIEPATCRFVAQCLHNKSVERIVLVLVKIANSLSKFGKGLVQGIVCPDSSLS